VHLQYLKPQLLEQRFDREVAGITQAELFHNPRYQKITEWWVAARFGLGYEMFVNPCDVAINEGDHDLDADMFLKASEIQHAFQIAEVQEEGRRRAQEYRKFEEGTISSVPYLPGRGAIEGPVWIANGIEKKVKKRYADAKNLNLLIYANFSATQLKYEDILDATQQYRNEFKSIWVLTNHLIASLYSYPELGHINGWGTFEIQPSP
tara:strand:- start:596 stop:1216 length:621 start_codon:yes stop_codon:yes gene_type:complete